MMNDLSYLRGEYAREKAIESYHREIHKECDEYRIANGQEPISWKDDGEQEGDGYSLFPVPATGQQKPDGKKALAGIVVVPVSEERTA